MARFEAWYPDRNCQEVKIFDLHAGSPVAIDYETRSENVTNPKDSYGFRAMSNFNAGKHKVDWPNGHSEGILAGGSCGFTVREKVTGLYDDVRHAVAATSDVSVSGLQTDALMRQRAEANLARGDINVLQFAAFLPSTMRTMRDNAVSLRTLLTEFRNINWKRELRQGGNARSLYLQYLFVYNQLYRDLLGGYKHLTEKAGLQSQLVRGRSFNTSTGTTNVLASNAGWTPPGNIRVKGTKKVDQRCVAVARITCETTYAANRLGLTNPIYLGWDLVKYSWIIDQVVDIGGAIGSLSSLHGLEYLGTSLTTHRSATGTISVEQVGYLTPSFSQGGYEYKNVVRRVYDTPFKGVTVRNPFRNNAMITAAALAALSLELKATRNIYATVVNSLNKRG